MERPQPKTVEQYNLLDCCKYMEHLGYNQEARDLSDTIIQDYACGNDRAIWYSLDVEETTSDAAFIKCFPQFEDDDSVCFWVCW